MAFICADGTRYYVQADDLQPLDLRRIGFPAAPQIEGDQEAIEGGLQMYSANITGAPEAVLP
jgi:hypothetical protein